MPLGSETQQPHDRGPTDTHALTQLTSFTVQMLEEWTERTHTGAVPDPAPGDPGIPVLCAALASLPAVGEPSRARRTADAVARATALWARTAGAGRRHPGLYDGGLAGTLVGLRLGSTVQPALRRAADRLDAGLLGSAADRAPTPGRVTFPDYDLVLGPSGTLLALCAGAEPHRPELAPYVDMLTSLCASDDLASLRTAYAGHRHLDWLDGRVNTGMAHGAAGVAAALTASVRRCGRTAEQEQALRTLCEWLRRQSFTDALGVRSWDGAGLDAPPAPGARARQAWCYGTPGISWALWDASEALGDRAGAEWAAEAFTSLADRYDEAFHLFGEAPGDLLGLCHGACGVLAVADAFHRHARLPAATALRARLLSSILDGLPDVAELARAHMTLLGGAGGVLTALLTTAAGASRAWLPCVGLR
ncbi:lanthionine synthetase LanC family protein [Streptomyces xiaopingdaonensis]|uniref:lanthionine synthetase LanC family protein n=1 Tax=Streptomyces xiaopingdaonensis TaxID=1565415 RepID=UPI00030687BB|nr:lanthionine synthetase LanC family protein [Streptomyces xiaopingdaonensis]